MRVEVVRIRTDLFRISGKSIVEFIGKEVILKRVDQGLVLS